MEIVTFLMILHINIIVVNVFVLCLILRVSYLPMKLTVSTLVFWHFFVNYIYKHYCFFSVLEANGKVGQKYCIVFISYSCK